MRFCVLYPKAENVHLIKDVGMIAYKLNSIFGYDSFVASYKNGEYDYLENEVKGLKMDFIENKSNHIINIFNYLKNNSKNIDMLQIFHMTLNSVIYAFFYKLFNKNGKIFLKLDCTEELVNKIKNANLLTKLFINTYLNKVDIIGVEQQSILKTLKEIMGKHSHKLLHVPNGIDFDIKALKEPYKFENKENIILTVGRIGSIEKANDVLMNAFALLDDSLRAQWKLYFVGPVDENFKPFIESFFEKHPHLKESISFKGAIFDRAMLYEEYKKAKLFTLTSEYESFGIALIEAAACGDVIISTKVGIADELVKDKNGIILNKCTSEELASALTKLIKDVDLETLSQNTSNLCRDNFDWNEIVTRLNDKFKEIKR